MLARQAPRSTRAARGWPPAIARRSPPRGSARRNGVRSRPRTPSRVGSLLASAASRPRPRRHPSRARRDRVAEQDRRARVEIDRGGEHRRRLLRRVDAMLQLDRRLPREEERQAVHAVADEGHAELLQALRRGRRVDDRLGPAAHQQPRRPRELHEVGAHVRALARMHAADAAGRAHADPGARGGPDRRGHRGRAEAAARARRREIAPRDLVRPAGLGERIRAPRRRAPPRPRPSSTPTHAGTAPAPRIARRHAIDALDVAGMRQSLADHARLQADDRASVARGPPRTSRADDGWTVRSRAAPPATRMRSPPRCAPARHASRNASPGSTPRASDASKTPSNASPAPVGIALLDRLRHRLVDPPVQHQHGPRGPSLHARRPVALAERARGRDRPPPRSATSASRSLARTTVAPAVSSSNPVAPRRLRPAATTPPPRRSTRLATDGSPRAPPLGHLPAAGGSPTPAPRRPRASAGRSAGTRRAFAPRSATIERSPASKTTSIVPEGASGSSTSAASTPRTSSSVRRSLPDQIGAHAAVHPRARARRGRPDRRVGGGAAGLESHASVDVASPRELARIHADVEHHVAHADQVHRRLSVPSDSGTGLGGRAPRPRLRRRPRTDPGPGG